MLLLKLFGRELEYTKVAQRPGMIPVYTKST